ALAQAGVLIASVALLTVCLGFWVPGRESATSGYGIYSMNLLSPFWPVRSGLLVDPGPSPDGTGGQYEGVNYLGLGVLIGLVLLFVKSWRAMTGTICRHPWLTAYLLFLCAFAVSHVIYLGSIKVATLPMPLYELFSQFRSSGRMFWPVTYILAVLRVAECARWAGWWRLVLPTLVLIQVADVWPFLGMPTFSKSISEQRQTELNQLERFVASHER